MTYFTKTLLLVMVAGASACSSDIEDTDDLPDNVPGDEGTTGSPDNTFDHDNSGKSPWDVIAEQQVNGPARYTSRIHGCVKIRYSAVGNILRSRGINTAGNAAANSAGGLYNSGQNSMGAPSYVNRVRENHLPTTAGMSRLFDIFASASTEIIAGFAASTIDACKVNGVSPPLFNNNGAECNPEAFKCLLGLPLTAEHVDICNKTIAGARNANNQPDPAIGQRLAVAALLSAAHICE